MRLLALDTGSESFLSGPAKIPDDPSLVLNLVTENSKLEKYRIPEEEIESLVQEYDRGTDSSGYAASEVSGD